MLFLNLNINLSAVLAMLRDKILIKMYVMYAHGMHGIYKLNT